MHACNEREMVDDLSISVLTNNQILHRMIGISRSLTLANTGHRAPPVLIHKCRLFIQCRLIHSVQAMPQSSECFIRMS